jgi:hypothetical protein
MKLANDYQPHAGMSIRCIAAAEMTRLPPDIRRRAECGVKTFDTMITASR